MSNTAPVCPKHNKVMKLGKFGYFCSTPIEKDSQGNVIKWCDIKPKDLVEGATTPQNQPISSEPIREVQESDKPDWPSIKAREQESMFRMSALKAASEVVSAYLQRPDAVMSKSVTELLLEVSNRAVIWLRSDSSVPEPEVEELF